ncbi:MAG: RNA polymerase sigma factor [Planctomycetota bacterium]
MESEPTLTEPTLDRPTFARQYTEVYPRLLLVGYAMLGNRTAAEDVVQEAVAAALTKMSDFTPGTHFAAWLTQFVRHAALNARRRQNTRRAASLDDDGAPEPAAGKGTTEADAAIDPAGGLREDGGHFDDALRSELDALPATARACLLLRTVAELDYAEISRTLDIPRGTAMSHVHRARQQLRRRLTQDDEKPGGV